MLNMEAPDRMKKGRPQRKFMDVVQENMQRVGVTWEYSRDREGWSQMTRFCDL